MGNPPSDCPDHPGAESSPRPLFSLKLFWLAQGLNKTSVHRKVLCRQQMELLGPCASTRARNCLAMSPSSRRIPILGEHRRNPYRIISHSQPDETSEKSRL